MASCALPEIESVQLIGELNQDDIGQWSIGQQSIEIDELLLEQDLDKRLLISGHFEDGVIIADAIGLDSVELVLDQVTEMIYEGILFDMEVQDFHEASDLLLELDSFSDEVYEEGDWESDDYYDDYYEEDEHENFDDYTEDGFREDNEGDYLDEDEIEYGESEFEEDEQPEDDYFDESEIDHEEFEDIEEEEDEDEDENTMS